MGCINGKQLLNEEDLNYIARNTAMDKDAVEVVISRGLVHYELRRLSFTETISELLKKTS